MWKFDQAINHFITFLVKSQSNRKHKMVFLMDQIETWLKILLKGTSWKFFQFQPDLSKMYWPVSTSQLTKF